MLPNPTNNIGHNMAAAISPRALGPSARDKMMEVNTPIPIIARFVPRTFPVAVLRSMFTFAMVVARQPFDRFVGL